MPLFSGRRNSGEISRATAERNAVSVQREASVLQLHAMLFSAYSSRQQARVAVKQLQQNVIPALQEAAIQTQRGYLRGHFGFLEYITASQELLESKRMLIDSAAAVLMYGAEIEQLTADSVSVTPLTSGTTTGHSK
jgi:cobalt-zinc-cadmium efflux system outer membrane protein